MEQRSEHYAALFALGAMIVSMIAVILWMVSCVRSCTEPNPAYLAQCAHLREDAVAFSYCIYRHEQAERSGNWERYRETERRQREFDRALERQK